ncbi:MAG: hypothetical protein KC731_07260 [Myxococcales bacterium]|nr:hypothetical protein [Myxococcales bacterium]
MHYGVWPLGLALLLVSAATSAAEPLAAEELFDRGIDVMRTGDVEAACPLFAESHRLEPRPGTLFTLAECWARAGRVATALARYKEYLRIVGRMPPARQKAERGRPGIAEGQVAHLEGEVPRITLLPAGDWPEGVEVSLNGVVLGEPSLRLPLPTDPGEQVVVTRAPGGAQKEVRVTVDHGQQVTIDLVVEPAPVPPRPEPPVPEVSRAPVPAPPGPAPAPAASQAADRMSPYMVGAWSLVGLTGAGVITGTVMGAIVLSRGAVIDAACDSGSPRRCTPEGAELARATQQLAHGSTVAFAIAGATAVGALTLFVVGAQDQVTLAMGPTTVFVGGVF